ncbi:MAG: hypothetical protein H6977_15820 [Gammaproteobacteria bacterium]|nr:hypothetical protein [Gammaproteobacteria bacterium]MCP5201470.1 hypothetical protein [Gammaproteobacteria bacterium]
MSPGEVHYKVGWRAAGHHPGHHPSRQQGGGLHFQHHVPLADAPDPRRFDVRASLRDPFERIQVRVYRQTSAIPVWVVADLSASMAYAGTCAKTAVLADLVAGLGYSAYRTGDRFGFVGCAERPLDDWLMPSTMNRAGALDLAARLRGLVPHGRGADGLATAAGLLGARRALVFLVSDFHLPLELVERTLLGLALHDVVPVVLWERSEYAELPRFGLARVRDAESGRSRLLFMRPALHRRIAAAYAARRERLATLFARHGRLPLYLERGFDADEVTHYFFG